MNVLNNYSAIFCFPMASYTKSNEVAQIIRLDFTLEKFALYSVMYVQGSFRKLLLCFSTKRAFIPVSFQSEVLLSNPIPSIVSNWSLRVIARMVFTFVKQSSTLSRTKHFINSFSKCFAAVLANFFGISFHAFTLAIPRTILASVRKHPVWLSKKGFSTNQTQSFNFFGSSHDLTLFTTVLDFSIFDIYRSHGKNFIAEIARQIYCFHKMKLPLLSGCRCLGGTNCKGSTLKDYTPKTNRLDKGIITQ